MLEYSQDRPWGSWHVLDEGPGYKVKRIEVHPGQRLSYQTHEYRSEHWLVIFGIATCVLDGATKVAGPGDCINVDHRMPHRIMNLHSENLVIIEIQRGAYTGEDETRRQVREMVEAAGGAFFLVHVATPLEECERRDRKGLYAKARRGEIPEFTGISSPYEEPHDAAVRVDTTGRTIEAALDDVIAGLVDAGYLTPEPTSVEPVETQSP